VTAHAQADAQHLFNRFRDVAIRFGLTISLKKTEVLLQPVDRLTSRPPVVMAGETALPVVQRFCYLDSVLSSDANIDKDISSRIAKACYSFGRLARPLWDDHGIRLDTKVAVYKAAILTSLLFGSETWVLYRRHVRNLEQFHMRCLRRIAHVRWHNKWPNTEVHQICNISGIEALVTTAQFRWTGHVIRMSNNRLPKIIFYSELKDGARSRGGQGKRYKDTLKADLKLCSIVPADLETLVMERSKWRSLCKTSIQQFESDRIRSLEGKREQRKTATIRSAACYPCQICGQRCASRIGLYSHCRTHQH